VHSGIKLLVVLTLGVLGACTGVTRSGHTVKDDQAPAVLAAQPQITRLIIDYTPAATKQTTDDERFNGSALNKAIGRELAARGLANLDSAAVVRVAALEMEEFDVRATSNLVLMGRVASRGVLGGRVRIRDGSGTQLREFHVRADMALNIARNGTDDNPLENLYREFANLVADELTGAVSQPKSGNLRQ
jgi:hypothetical protein